MKFSVCLLCLLAMFFPDLSCQASFPSQTFSSLSEEQRNNLFINSNERIYASPGDTLRLQIMTMNYRTIPPMPGIPVDVGAAWQVVPSSSGVTLDENRALLVVGREVKDGSLFTVSAQIAQRGKVRNNSLYVYTRQANPFAGNWREDGGNIGELYVYPDRRFSVTVHPFELYRDYWGHISYDLKNRRISFTIEGGNRIPADFDLEGAFRIRKDGALELNGIYFGTMDRTDSFKQRCLFRKAGK